jgi:tetratricopeptide (TPR) repeat protein
MKSDCIDFSRSAGKVIAQIFLACLFITTLQMNLSAQEEAGLSAEQKIQKAQEHYLKGKELIQAQDYQTADEEFKKAQQILESASPPTTTAEAQTADVVVASENKAPPDREAITQEATAVSSAPAAKEVKPPALSEVASQAKELDQKGQLESAISLYLKAIEQQPNNPNLYYNLAVEYLKTYNYSLAEEEFKRVIALNPKDKDAYYNLGVLYESYIIDKKQAIICYTQYLKLASRAQDRDKVKAWIKQINQEITKKNE